MGLLDDLRNRSRRRRAVRRYLGELSHEIHDRESRLDSLERKVASEREGFHDRVVSDVLVRTEMILEQLDRRIEEVALRTSHDMAELERRLAELHDRLTRL